jgi:hypothetical protein
VFGWHLKHDREPPTIVVFISALGSPDKTAY